jgi:hypothetical protein
MTEEDRILSAFFAFRDALMTCDTQALESLLASDYRSYNLQGHLEGREVVLGAYVPGITTLEEWEMEELEVEVFSEVGVITGKGFVAGKWQGQPWSHHLRFMDVWVIREGRWQILLSQATPMEE